MQRSRKNQTSCANPLDTGYGFANSLLGVYQSFNQVQNHINGQYRYWNIEQYVQETWKVTNRLTLDYGLRGSWYQPQYDASLQASSFELSDWDPKQAPSLYIPAINPMNNTRSAYNPVTGTYLPVNYIGILIPGRVPDRRVQRLQSHHIHGGEQRVELHCVPGEQQRRYHRITQLYVDCTRH